jgi:serine/threonine protein kinase
MGAHDDDGGARGATSISNLEFGQPEPPEDEEELTPVISIEALPGRPSEERPLPRLAQYELLQSIGSGGMAEVFLAKNTGPMGFEKIVVLKCIHPHLAKEKHFVTMFLDEARLAARINDPRVVQIHELGESGGTYFMAMEYLAGESLSTIVKTAIKGGPSLSVHLAARIVGDAAAGLHTAHELKDAKARALDVVHRDISHGNIYVCYSGAVKVLDFGVAKARDSLQTTSPNERKGKYGYMSPEQVQGNPIDRRSDVFSLGVVLWEAITKQRLFAADSELETVRRVIDGVPPAPSTINKDVPPEMDAIVAKALAKDRAKRYQTAEELSKELESFIRTSGQAAGMSEISAFMKSAFAERMEKRAKLVRVGHADLAEPPLATIDTVSSHDEMHSEIVELRRSRRRLRLLLAGLAASICLASAYYLGGRKSMREPSANASVASNVQKPVEKSTEPVVQDASGPHKFVLEAMLDRAQTAIEQGRIASPPGENALELILDVEKQDPSLLPRTKQLRDTAKATLLSSAEALWNAGKQESARDLYADVLLFEADHPTAKERTKKKPAAGKPANVTSASPDQVPWLVSQIDLAIIERRLVGPPGRNALEYLQQLHKLDPKNDAVRRLGGEVATALRAEAKAKPAEAKELLAAAKVASAESTSPVPETQVVEKVRDPKQAAQWIEAGNQHLVAGALTEARTAFERAVTADSASHAALAGLAEVAYNESDYTRAVLAAKRAIVLAPLTAQYRMLLGKSYYKMLRYEDAIKQWEKALELDPANTAAQKNIEMARRRMGEDDEK